jgi:hypothetical protein
MSDKVAKDVSSQNLINQRKEDQMTKTQDSSKFYLTADETTNLKGREKCIPYIQDLVRRDMQVYIFSIVLPRLGVKSENIKVDKDFKWIEVLPTILGPNGKAVTSGK